MKTKNQVQLHELIFSLNWEDPQSDIRALQIRPGDNVMTISSGGCNTFEFLLHDPAHVYALDINPAQSYLMELKTKAFKHLGYEEFCQLMGLRQVEGDFIYAKLRPLLSVDARNYWDARAETLEMGLIMSGRYERFVKLACKAITILQGKRVVEGLFRNDDQKEQQLYFDSTFNTWRFRSIFPILFNKRMLARKGLNSDYFHFDDGSKSFSESFFNRAKNAIRNLPLKGNYFLSLYLTGRYQNEDEMPEYLKRSNFEIIRERVDRIQIITQDANEWLASRPDECIDAFSLSNICELKSEPDTRSLFDHIARVGKAGGKCCFRNLMVPREIPSELESRIQKDVGLSKELLTGDRSFVYSKVAAYVIHK
ncbi:MAG: DUF3419 family protein [Chryseolinea sp.]